MYNDKILENINSQIEGLTSAVKKQISFNKMVESQLAKIADTIPISNDGKIPAQPKNSCEKVNALVMGVVSQLVTHQILTILQEK